MKIIIDVNVILSALIKDSMKRKILIYSGLDFYFPKSSLDKINKYRDYVLKKSKLSLKEYNLLLTTLLGYVNLLDDDEILKKWNEARKIFGHIDPEDMIFIAAALSIGAAIWSDDNDFDRQDEIRVFKTKEFQELF